jgi:tetratricopeptide (TPR) repeat protein
MQLGTAYTWLKEFDKAIPALRKAVEMRPDTMMPHYELGLSLSETGDWLGSIPHFQAAVEKSPKWGALRYSLAAAYAHVDRLDDAHRELETALKLNPDDYRANLLLGRMLSVQGRPAQGLPNLKKATRLQPKDINAHLFLADAYERLGQKANAARERAEAERLRASGGQ